MKRVRAVNDRTELASATGRSLVLARTNQFIVFQRIAEMALDQIFQKLLPLLKLLGRLGDRCSISADLLRGAGNGGLLLIKDRPITRYAILADQHENRGSGPEHQRNYCRRCHRSDEHTSDPQSLMRSSYAA